MEDRRVAHFVYYLVQQMKDCIELKQSAYTKKILEKAGMQAFNPTKYPMDPKEHLTNDEGGKLVDPTEYKSLVGGLRYLVHTCPDMAYDVGIVSRLMEKPTVLHMNAIKRILRYVKGTINYGLVYSRDIRNNMLTGYSNSDFGGQTDDRKSTRGMVFYLNDNLITWVSQKQRCVALSSCEAEFMGGTTSACQAVWLRNLLSKLTGEDMGPVILYIDDKSAIDLARNLVFHGRSTTYRQTLPLYSRMC
ncbi:secreted RxLR effector protein 161-like [Apium graveolens]|uniref:secreted RxLR effector protein 161-like n=1 Tax=Apium graveolens TaxID=4045 RepID=UPI003D7A8982